MNKNKKKQLVRLLKEYRDSLKKLSLVLTRKYMVTLDGDKVTVTNKKTGKTYLITKSYYEKHRDKYNTPDKKDKPTIKKKKTTTKDGSEPKPTPVKKE